MKTNEPGPALEEIRALKEKLAEKEREIEELRINKMFLETLFDGINEEIMVIDSKYNIQNVNRVFLERYGLEKEKILGRKCYEVKYGGGRPCNFAERLCPLKKADERGERIEVVHWQESAGGDPRELMQIMYPAAVNHEGQKFFVEISRDVTEYRNLIKKLQVSEKRFRAILDTATDAIISLNEERKIVLFNNAAERIFGYSRKEVLGEDFEVLIPSQRGASYREVKKFLRDKSPGIQSRTLALTGVRKGGARFPIEMGFSCLEVEGRPTFTAVMRDVTVQRQLEKKLLQSERLAAVGQAVAHVAHEIKNPLMIIGAFSHQLRRALKEERVAQKLEMVIEEVRRLEKLVANLGDFTKEYKLVKRPADINSVLEDVLKIMEEIYAPERYDFRRELSPGLKEIHCDPDKLKQVFMNIIANGIEAMKNGGVITMATVNRPRGIEIQFRDEGVGMSEEELLHMFEPFYTTRKTGSGLGLAISYKIVQAHKGEIWAESRPGKGTTLFVSLPAG